MNEKKRKMKEEKSYEECLDDYMFWRERLEMIKSYPILEGGYEGVFQFAQERLDKACRDMLGV
jgi:2-phosphoglycerate kinase